MWYHWKHLESNHSLLNTVALNIHMARYVTPNHHYTKLYKRSPLRVLSTRSAPHYHWLWLLSTCKVSTSPSTKIINYFFYRFSTVNSIHVCNVLFAVECCDAITLVSTLKFYPQNVLKFLQQHAVYHLIYFKTMSFFYIKRARQITCTEDAISNLSCIAYCG
jgi:hypothetical protein